MSRCPKDARLYREGDKLVPYSDIERVVKDIAIMAKKKKLDGLGQLTTLGLSSLNLYHTAHFSNNSHLTEYILALAAYSQKDEDCTRLSIISDSLKTLYHVQGGWSGNEVVQVVQMVGLYIFTIPVSLC